MLNKSIKILLLVMFLFIGVNGTVIAACSCANYYYKYQENIFPPQWVKGDNIIDGNYYSSGSIHCTGIKSIDEKRSANNARKRLSQMLNSDVKVSETQTTTIRNQFSSSTHTIDTTTNSEKLITNGVIYDRWVDNQTCTVYSAIRVTKKDIEEAEKLQKQTFFSLPFCINAIGKNSHYLNDKITSVLLEKQYKLASNKECVVEYTITNKIIETKSHLVKTKLIANIKVNKNNQYLLKNTYYGKGISYNNKRSLLLTELAIDDAIDNLISDLEKIKNRRIN